MKSSACLLLIGFVALSGCASRTQQASTPPTLPSGTAQTGSRDAPAKPSSSAQSGTTADRSRTDSAGAETKTAGSEAARQPASRSDATGGLTGCLSKGDAANSYVLTDESGKRTVISGTADFAKHVGHRVRLTGDAATSGTFNVAKIEHLAASCAGQ
jgi:hypothetical protein